MKKEQKQKHQLDQFEDHCHLWNIIPGGQGKGIVLLRKIVDAIQHDNYAEPGNKPPVVLITGQTGKRFAARALANSLAIEDVRICPGKYFENGYYSHQFFSDSYLSTAHIITNIEDMQNRVEPTLWRYMKNRQCRYYSGAKKEYDSTVYCNGLIVITAKHRDKVSPEISKATDYVVELEPLNLDQIEAALHQRLVFCGVEYDGDEVLKAIVSQEEGQIEYAIQFLKQCLLIMKAEMADCLSLEVVKKASRIGPIPAHPPVQHGDDIPF